MYKLQDVVVGTSVIIRLLPPLRTNKEFWDDLTTTRPRPHDELRRQSPPDAD